MTPPGTVNAADQAKLISYLNNGGNVYVESVNIGIDHYGTEFIEKLGIKFKDDGDFEEVDYLKAKSDELLRDIDFDYTGGDDPHYSVDELLSTTATPLYNCEDDISRMFYLETDDYKVISSSVVIGAFKDSDSLSMKTYLMAEIVNYFLGITTITDIGEVFAAFDVMEVNAWPNPFIEQINISFNVDKTADVSVRIFDETGRMINNLFEGSLSNGSHSFVWAGNSTFGARLNNGIYFYRVEINGKSKSGKILLSR
jgi:hypothetical protein